MGGIKTSRLVNQTMANHKDVSLKSVPCETCGREMEVDVKMPTNFSVGKGPKCWQCVASGRAFMEPEKAKKLPVEDVTSDAYIKRVDGDVGAPGYKTHAQREKENLKASSPRPGSTGGTSSKRKVVRLGQTKLIDDLLTQGMSPKDVEKKVHEEIPQYPKEKLPTLIKIRQYHLKKIAGGKTCDPKPGEVEG